MFIYLWLNKLESQASQGILDDVHVPFGMKDLIKARLADDRKMSLTHLLVLCVDGHGTETSKQNILETNKEMILTFWSILKCL